VRRAFDARTDTLSTWGLLQKNCLLLKAEEERSQSSLSNRLQQAREAREQRTEEDEQTPKRKPVKKPTEAKKSSVIRRIRPVKRVGEEQDTADSEKITRHPDYLQPVAKSKTKRPTKPLKRLPSMRPTARSLFWLTSSQTGRHITLPAVGEIVLGRFDPHVGIPPDIDLAFEDQETHLISRRHAKLIGQNGKHVIEDLGSRSGVFINDAPVKQYGRQYPLKPGDKLRLGELEFVYEEIPEHVLEAAKQVNGVRHVLTVTPTGRKLSLNPQRKIIIGRSDAHIDFVPDIDLSPDGEVAHRVSRRHALLQWKLGQPHIEDLGSGFGTRLGGEGLSLGEATALKPGDHIWLAGCVLVYDIETQGGR